MKTVKIKTSSVEQSVVVCRKDVLSAQVLQKEIGGKAFVLTDENVLRLYGKKLRRALPEASVFAMPAGEANKTAETLFAVLGEMAKAELARSSTLVALGGGVVGDLGGLAAALYMRGIACVQIPTTLLAQVDSSVGGKTAVDFGGVKNLVGAFHQPARVLVDSAFLHTLPEREIRCGLGEIIKHGALNGRLFDTLWDNRERLFERSFLAQIVPENIAFKAEIVRKDPHDDHLRKCLNLGHTTGHALELGEGALSHGEYVMLGILYEAELAKQYLDCDKEYLSRLQELCLRVLAVKPYEADAASCAKLARLDKKNSSADAVTAIVPVRKGEYAELKLPFEDYVQALRKARERLC